MAAIDVDDWIPEEWSGEVVQRVQQMSVVERFARPWTMANRTRHVPRSAGMDVEGIAARSRSVDALMLSLIRRLTGALREIEERAHRTASGRQVLAWWTTHIKGVRDDDGGAGCHRWP